MAIYNFLKNTKGSTAIEYAVIASLLSVFILGAVLILGQTNRDSYTKTADKVADAMTP